MRSAGPRVPFWEVSLIAVTHHYLQAALVYRPQSPAKDARPLRWRSYLSAYGATPLLTNSPDGEAGQIILNGDGTTSIQTFPTVSSGPVLSILPAVVTPEPASLGLLGLSLGLAGLRICRCRMLRRNGTTV